MRNNLETESFKQESGKDALKSTRETIPLGIFFNTKKATVHKEEDRLRVLLSLWIMGIKLIKVSMEELKSGEGRKNYGFLLGFLFPFLFQLSMF